MTIATYAQLQTAVADNLARGDLVSFIPDFIASAEDWLNFGTEQASPLRVREMEHVEQIAGSSGAYALPADYLQYVQTVELAGTRRLLTYVTLDTAEKLYPSRAGGLACHFTIVGGNLLTLPLASNDVELTYYRSIPRLSDSVTSNWLLAKSPSTYLRATLAQAAEFTKNDEEAAKQSQLAIALVAGLNRSDLMGKYARAGLAPRAVGP